MFLQKGIQSYDRLGKGNFLIGERSMKVPYIGSVPNQQTSIGYSLHFHPGYPSIEVEDQKTSHFEVGFLEITERIASFHIKSRVEKYMWFFNKIYQAVVCTKRDHIRT